jgi:oxepin-CoA hydrolase/3-oxo-5,6-dehydrosuberyl-CoA semialdehyde dehydrogenase
MPYQNIEHAMSLARAGEGSLAGTLVTASGELARAFILGAARTHGRIQILNEASSAESTGHGSPLPQLVHGGPGAPAAAKSWAACGR